jgi:hypothetical protein
MLAKAVSGKRAGEAKSAEVNARNLDPKIENLKEDIGGEMTDYGGKLATKNWCRKVIGRALICHGEECHDDLSGRRLGEG